MKHSDDGPNFTNNGDNSYHVVTGTDTDQTAILDGFVITGGNANGSPWPWVDDRGGGMQNYIDGHPMLVNCTFTGNYAANGGAGMDNEYDCSPTLVNCVFADNWSSVHSAGLLDAYDCSPALTNCLFMGNSADGFGAGMINADYCDPVLVNCTFSENTAGDFTGGIYSTHDSAPTLANCILWNNADAAGTDEIAQIYTDNGLVSINYCCIKGWTGALGGDGNIGEDPLLVDPGNDDFSIAAGSPCIDAADNTAVPADIADLDGDGDRSERTPRDLGGDPRFLDDPDTDDSGVPAAEYPHVVDMGAYEFIPARVIYVDSRAPYGGDGWSWSTAFNDLQEALSISRSVDEIWVAEGTYKPGASRADAFAMKNGLGMYGGFAGTETARDQRDPATYQTILSGDIGAQGDTSDNCYHVFDHPDGTNLDGTAVLDGFTITGGNGNEGGGMYNYSSSPTVRDCTFTSNLADYGGGIHNYSSAPTIADCSFSDNSAREVGGGICNWSFSSPTVTNCAFLHNSAIGPSGGGGIHNSDSSPTVTNCMFMGNSLSGIGNHGSSSAAVTNCIFTSNSLSGISNYDSSSPTVANCTFAGNSLYGMSSYDSSSPTAANCIFWWDTPGEISGPAPVVEYCNVQGGWPGTGNIAAPPLLADPDGPDGIPGTADDDLRLLPNSPCIDAASNLWVPADVTDLDADGDTTERIPFDLDGDPRFVDEPWIPDLGVDDSPAYRNVADMGAYEFEPCHGDINTDGFRNTTDFMLFISAYGSYDDDPNYIPRADLWPDGHINTIDFMIFSQFYGQACP
jgi:parallel beta-helix repeat protein